MLQPQSQTQPVNAYPPISLAAPGFVTLPNVKALSLTFTTNDVYDAIRVMSVLDVAQAFGKTIEQLLGDWETTYGANETRTLSREKARYLRGLAVLQRAQIVLSSAFPRDSDPDGLYIAELGRIDSPAVLVPRMIASEMQRWAALQLL